MRKITADFQAPRDRDLGDVKVRLELNDHQATSWDISWDELEQLVQAGQRLLEKRQAILSTPKDLVDDDSHEYHDPCGHFHLGRQDSCPLTPCGDYRCCIN